MSGERLAPTLEALVDRHRREGGKNLEWRIAREIAEAERFGASDIDETVRTLMTAVDEALSSDQCKDKRSLQRSWVVGLAAGSCEHGLSPVDTAYICAYVGLRTAVDLAMILGVYAFSLSWGFAQAHARMGWAPELKADLLAAMERGLHDAEVHLGEEVQPQERKWMRENLGTGWKAGSFLARFADRYPG